MVFVSVDESIVVNITIGCRSAFFIFCAEFPVLVSLSSFNSFQNAVGLVDVEVLNHLIKLDEWAAKKRSLNVSETLRGDVLSLLCNKTVVMSAMLEDSNETNCSDVRAKVDQVSLEEQKGEKNAEAEKLVAKEVEDVLDTETGAKNIENVLKSVGTTTEGTERQMKNTGTGDENVEEAKRNVEKPDDGIQIICYMNNSE